MKIRIMLNDTDPLKIATLNNEIEAGIWLYQNGWDSGNPTPYTIKTFNPVSGKTLRAGSIVHLVTHLEQGDTETDYDSVEEAEQNLPTNPRDGWDMIDLEQPVGYTYSVLMDMRPQMWRNNM